MQRIGVITAIIIVYFFYFWLVSPSSASTQVVATERCGGHDSVMSWAIYLGGGWRSYLGVFQQYWDPYPFFGGTCDLPTCSPNIYFRLSADAGRVIARESSAMTLFSLHESFSGITEFSRVGPVRFRGGVGVSSATFFFSADFKINEKIFNSSESEFGLVSVLDAVCQLNKFEVISQCTFDYIFSLPNPLLMLSFGIQIGRAF